MKPIQFIIAFTLAVCSLNVKAQDSNFIELGRTGLRGQFTQGITIKGKDLAKLPFGTITEALQPWLMGAYTREENLVFVINGNIVADVNIYHIEDIEDITLVQNALVQVNGSTGQQQLVVVRLKQRKQPGTSLTVSGQANYIGVKPSSDDDNFYHRYHINANKNLQKARMGLSLGFLQDVAPIARQENFEVKKSPYFNRYQANGYIEFELHPYHSILARVNYVFQPGGASWTNSSTPPGIWSVSDMDLDNHLFQPELEIRSAFGGKFTNSLRAAYQSIDYDYLLQNQLSTQERYTTSVAEDNRNLLLQDVFRYHSSVGNWKVMPELSFTYRGWRNYYRQIDRSEFPGFPSGNISAFYSRPVVKQFTTSPSVDLSFKNIWNLKVGTVLNFSKRKTHTFYPFVSTSLDVPSAFGITTELQWKLFGSYAKGSLLGDLAFSLNEPAFYPHLSFGFGTGFPQPQMPDSNFYSLAAGTTIDFHGFRFSYHYEQRDFNGLMIIPVLIPGGVVYMNTFPQSLSRMHRFSISVPVIQKSNSNWQTGLHVTSIKTKFENIHQDPGTSRLMTGDLFNESRSWTGGWNNRIELKNFTAGLDLIFHNDAHGIYQNDTRSRDIFGLSFAYAGYRMKMRNMQGEFYVSARNIYTEHDYRNTIDPRKYYGLGFRLLLP
jgi:hypothetical protein